MPNGGITGFDPLGFKVVFNHGGSPYTTNATGSVSQIGNSLNLAVTIPEPSTLALALLGCLAIGLAASRRQRVIR